MKKYIFIFLLVCSVNVFAAEQKPLLSVFDFKGSNIAENELLLFIDFLTSEIVNTGQYKVIDRMQRETILSEIEFSLTGCTDESCQLEAGKMLQANDIVVGSLGTFGEKTLVNMKLVEVETGATLSSVSQKYDSFNEVVVDIHRLVNLLLKDQAPELAAAESTIEWETPIATNFDLFEQTDDLIHKDLKANFQLIQDRAKSLSPEERKALYDGNDKNVVSGSLLNILPGFGVGSFINGDPGTGFMQLALDAAGIAGMTVWSIGNALDNSWRTENMQYFQPDDSSTFENEGIKGNFIIDGVISNPDTGLTETLGVIGLVLYGASKIAGALIPAITYDSYNDNLGSALNLNN